jgi:hypothetical protein
MKLVSLKSAVTARCTHYVSSSRTLLFMMAGFCFTSTIAAKVYINYHMNSGVGGAYDALFTPSNEADGDHKLEASGKEHIQEREFRSGLQALKVIEMANVYDHVSCKELAFSFLKTNQSWKRRLTICSIHFKSFLCIKMDRNGPSRRFPTQMSI